MKKFIKGFSMLALVFALLLGSITGYTYSLSNGGSSNDMETQIELLNMLFNHSPSDLARIIPFGLDGEQTEIPNVVLVALPETEGEMFFIAIDNEVTPEAVDFILSFTGISREKADIAQLLNEVVEIGPEIVDELYNGFHPNFFNSDSEILYSFDSSETRQIFGGIVMMGQIINIPGVGSMTLGHPNNVAGSRFFTAPHRVLATGTRVNQGTTQIGTITRSLFGGNRDVAEVAVGNGVGQVSPVVPWANRNITNFRGNATNGMSVRSIRGLSGVVTTRIENANFSFTASGLTWTNMILTYPNVRSQEGDSGSALIHTSGTTETVLGTRRSRLEFADGRVMGVYTRVQNYN